MKKVLVVLLLLVVAGGLFADVTGFGRFRTKFGVDLTLKPEDVDPTWQFAFNHRIGLNIEADKINAWIFYDGDWAGDATVEIGPATLSIGLDELAWAQWSSLAYDGNGNYGFGASTSNQTPYIKAGFSGFYLGLSEAGEHYSGTQKVNGATFDEFAIPGFFLGYDLGQDAFSAGFAFAGLAGKYKLNQLSNDETSIFAWMGNVHGKINLDPATIGLNVAFYGAPDYGFFTLLAPGLGGDKAMVLEGMVDVGIGLDPCSIGLTFGILMNMADEADGGGASAFQIGAGASFDVGGGFKVIPGVIFTSTKWKPAGTDVEYSTLRLGVTLVYNF